MHLTPDLARVNRVDEADYYDSHAYTQPCASCGKVCNEGVNCILFQNGQKGAK